MQLSAPNTPKSVYKATTVPVLGQLLCLVFRSGPLTLNPRIGLLQGARGRDSVHARKLEVERGIGEHTTSRRLIVPEDHHAETSFHPDCQVQHRAAKAPEWRHVDEVVSVSRFTDEAQSQWQRLKVQ